MNVFVIGTGRCGTMTFSRACRHIKNYSSGHESRAGVTGEARFAYRAHHIEVDPHIAWTLGPIIRKYPTAYFVHLQRNREEVIESWFRRGRLPNRGAAPLIDVICQAEAKQLPPAKYRAALEMLYDTVNANIEMALRPLASMHIWLHEAADKFAEFWKAIDAEGDLAAATAEFQKRYNAGRR